MIGIATWLFIALISGQQPTTGNSNAVEPKDHKKPHAGVTTATANLAEHGTDTSGPKSKAAGDPTPPKAPDGLSFSDYVNLATLFFTFLFLYFTILTWKQMVRSNDHAEKTYDESTRETQESLDLTRKGQQDTQRAVEIAERQLTAAINVVRAWITLDGIGTEINWRDGLPRRAGVVFRNTGQSPAIQIWGAAEAGIGKTSGAMIDSDRQPPPDRVVENKGKVSLGPNGTFTAHVDVRDLTPQERRDVLSGEVNLYIVGVMEYRDIFATEDRRLIYCARYEVAESSWTTTINTPG